MRSSRRANHPLFIEETEYNWKTEGRLLRKLFLVTLLGFAAIGLVMLVTS